MSRRILLPSLVLLCAVAGWAMLEADAPRSRHSAPAVEDEASRTSPVVIATASELPRTIASTHPTTEPSSLAGPLARQRDRLHQAESRLQARREEARARHMPPATQRALDDHVARVQQRLAALDQAPR